MGITKTDYTRGMQCPMLTGVNQTTIADIKKKRNTAVNVRILFELCQGLGIDIVEFFNSPIFKTENIVD